MTGAAGKSGKDEDDGMTKSKEGNLFTMKKRTVLVTGTGALIGYGILRSLRKAHPELRLIAMDIYPDAVGQYFADEFIRARRADAPDYPEFLCGTIERYGVDLVFFGTEQELFAAFDARRRMGGHYAKLAVNTPELIRISKDKFALYQALTRRGLPAIPSRIDGSYREIAGEMGTPFLLKRRRSYASKGLAVIEDEADFSYFRRKAGEDFMAQPIIGSADREYTVGIFGYGDGTSTPPFQLIRRLSGEGATAKARIVHSAELDETVRQLVAAFEPVGPTNFQFREAEGRFWLLEINPRISSSASIRAAFGYDEASLSLDFYLDHLRTPVKFADSGSAVRYIADWIIP